MLDSYAIRAFRDIADGDYVSARLAHRARLAGQFLWSSQQAIEKYLKCILLLNRIKAKKLKHDLAAGLDLIDKKLPFQIDLSDDSRTFIREIDATGRFRYLEVSFWVDGGDLQRLDRCVWELRRFCQQINYRHEFEGGEVLEMLPIELDILKEAASKAPHEFSLDGGELEKILANLRHPAREPLLWRNCYFGEVENVVPEDKWVHVVNHPFAYAPEYLEDVAEFVYLPKELISAIKAHRKSEEEASG